MFNMLFGDESLKREIKDLKADFRLLEERNLELREDQEETENRITRLTLNHAADLRRIRTEHEVTLANLKSSRVINEATTKSEHQIEIDRLENKIGELEASFVKRVSKEVAAQKKDLKARGERQDEAHLVRSKRLEADYLEKISRVDRKLEEDKSSYRKYTKQEFNSRIETLEKENKGLVVDNAKLKGANEVMETSRAFFSGKTESMGEALHAVVKALPTVSAEITTPETVIRMPEAPVQKSGGNNGGGQQKQ